MSVDYTTYLVVGVPVDEVMPVEVSIETVKKYNPHTGEPYQKEFRTKFYKVGLHQYDFDDYTYKELARKIQLEYINTHPDNDEGVIGIIVEKFDGHGITGPHPISDLAKARDELKDIFYQNEIKVDDKNIQVYAITYVG